MIAVPVALADAKAFQDIKEIKEHGQIDDPVIARCIEVIYLAYVEKQVDPELLKTYDCRIPGDTFGFDAVGLGDIDGDGTLDFLITSAWSGIRGFHSGRVFVISSGIRVS